MTALTDPFVRFVILLIALVCFAVWIVPFKLQAKHWRFELFTIDFSLGAFLAASLAAILLGSVGTDLTFNDRLLVSSRTAQAMMLVAGLVFGFGNTLILGAVSLLGAAGAFGIGGSLALLIGVALNRSTIGPTSLPIAASLFLLTLILSALACRAADPKPPAPPRGQPLGPIRLRRSTKGLLVAVLGGVALGFSYPLALRGTFDDFGLGPYAGLFIFCLGTLAVNCLFSLYFFNIALEGGALSFSNYFRGWPLQHIPGILAGGIWAAGALAILLTHQPVAAPAVPASCLPLISVPLVMLFGLLFWREFTKTKGPGMLLIAAALLAGAGGIGVLAYFL